MGKIDCTRHKTIVVDIEVYEALKNLGRTADSFNDVIRKLVMPT